MIETSGRNPEPYMQLLKDLGLTVIHKVPAVRFAEKVGMPPLQYVTYWRMQLACRALRETARSVADVAAEVGYSSESGFSRVFKKEKGLPPARYRAAMAAA